MGAGELYILGINAYDHDTSACLLRDGEIVAAIAKERLTRVKHDSGFFGPAVDYCLDVAGIELDRVDLTVRNCYLLPVLELERRLIHDVRSYHMTPRERREAPDSPLFLAEDGDRIATCSHHLAHAYSAFAASPFDEGAVMIVDGVGSYRADVLEAVPAVDEAHALAREAESYYAFHGGELETVRKVFMGPNRGLMNDPFFTMPGLGALYSRVSTYVFGDWNKCGEVMGLAPYGEESGEPLVWLEDGQLRLRDWGTGFRHPFAGLDDGAWARSPQQEEWRNLAWRIQADTERVLLERARWLHERTGARNLCLAGGVALNCVANGRLVRETPFENVWIQPAAGDDGVAIGCAYYGHLALRGRPRTFVMKHAYLGAEYDRFDEDEAVRPWSVRLATTRTRADDPAEAAAEILAAGSVIGWFQGRSEFGPRALGNRSILADPRDAAMRDRVNARVKHRQGFRPFAPVVAREKAHEYFVGDEESPFMLLAKQVRPEARDRVPAIVHVDGTARVQTVSRDDNPRLHALLTAFERRTGVAVLLNTSFNIRGHPIVEMPMDAVDCFLATQLDALVLHDLVLRKTWMHHAFAPVVRFMARLRRNLRSESLLERYAQQALGG